MSGEQEEAGNNTKSISVRVNGEIFRSQVPIRTLLVDFLRERLGLTGTHVGCSVEGRCGACAVLLNGETVKSCLLLAVQADGSEIVTVEGLAKDKLHATIQESFWKHHGLQCGFCTSGMLIAAYGLLKANPSPSLPEIKEGLAGNLCRCTGYQHIFKAVQDASARLAEMTREERQQYFPY